MQERSLTLKFLSEGCPYYWPNFIHRICSIQIAVVIPRVGWHTFSNRSPVGLKKVARKLESAKVNAVLITKISLTWKLYLMLTLMISSGMKANLNYCLCLIIENLYQVSSLNFLVVFWVCINLGTAPNMPTMHQWFNGYASHSSRGETPMCLCVWWVGEMYLQPLMESQLTLICRRVDTFAIHVEWEVSIADPLIAVKLLGGILKSHPRYLNLREQNNRNSSICSVMQTIVSILN